MSKYSQNWVGSTSVSKVLGMPTQVILNAGDHFQSLKRVTSFLVNLEQLDGRSIAELTTKT